MKTIPEEYVGGISIEELAAKHSISKRSVIARLVHAKVYKKEPYRSKNGEVPVFKEALIKELCELLGYTEAELQDLAKLNKTTLRILIKEIRILQTT